MADDGADRWDAGRPEECKRRGRAVVDCILGIGFDDGSACAMFVRVTLTRYSSTRFHAFGTQCEAGPDSGDGGFDLDVGAIKVPTTIDVRRGHGKAGLEAPHDHRDGRCRAGGHRARNRQRELLIT